MVRQRDWNWTPLCGPGPGRLSVSYLVVILQHLSDDSDLRVVVLYGDYSEKERTKTEAGSVIPMEAAGKMHLIISKWGTRQGQQPVQSEGLQALGQVKLCSHHCTSWWFEKEIARQLQCVYWA